MACRHFHGTTGSPPPGTPHTPPRRPRWTVRPRSPSRIVADAHAAPPAAGQATASAAFLSPQQPNPVVVPSTPRCSGCCDDQLNPPNTPAWHSAAASSRPAWSPRWAPSVTRSITPSPRASSPPWNASWTATTGQPAKPYGPPCSTSSRSSTTANAATPSWTTPAPPPTSANTPHQHQPHSNRVYKTGATPDEHASPMASAFRNGTTWPRQSRRSLAAGSAGPPNKRRRASEGVIIREPCCRIGRRLRARRTLSGMATWPATADELTQLQHALGELAPEPWQPPTTMLRIGACFVCFERVHGAGAADDRGFAGAAVTSRRQLLAGVSVSGPAGGPYRPTLLALREGPLLEQAVRALEITPEVLVVNATGRDHPRRAGLALHLGAVLGLPTVGVTTRSLVAEGTCRPTSAVPPRRCCWAARWWAAGRGPGRGPSRWPSMPPGRPTLRMRSRSCWPRPVVLGPQSPCAAHARWPEPAGHVAAERAYAPRHATWGFLDPSVRRSRLRPAAGRPAARAWTAPTRADRGRVGAPGRWPQSSPPPPQHPGGHSAATIAGWRDDSWPSTTASSHSAQPSG